MRLRNEQVIQKWASGEPAVSHTGALSTDGVDLMSYNLMIGYRSSAGSCILGDFTSPGGQFASVTTSCHVGKARQVVGHTMHPTVFQMSFPRSKL